MFDGLYPYVVKVTKPRLRVNVLSIPRQLNGLCPWRRATIMASCGRPSTALATDSYVALNYHCILARNPPLDLPVDPKSHITQHPKSDPRTKRCRHWSQPIVYRESAQLFAKSFALGWTEGWSRSYVLRHGFESLQPHRVDFPDPFTPPNSISKITNMISEMDRVLTRPLWR